MAEEKAQKPNIILILADDLGYGDLGSYGATKIPTPHTDKLAQQGMRFTDAHSSSAVCSPTRYSVLTGRYNWRSWLKNWVVHDHMPLLIDTERTTLPKMLQEEGYYTGVIGKWHLGWGEKAHANWNDAVKPGPNQVGFDYFYGVPISHNSVDFLRVYVRNDRIVGLRDGEDIHDKKVMKRVQRSLENTAVELSDAAVSFIDKHAKTDEPFFLYYPTTNVHFPITPANRFKDSSEAGNYGDFTVEFDWTIGEVMKSLERNKIADNTIVIVTSDNGGWPFQEATKVGHKTNGDLRDIKCTIYEGGHRVPMIVRWPGHVPANSVSDETVCLTDFMATFADITGYKLKNNMAEDSVSILPALKQEKTTKPLREATVHHSVAGMFAIRKGDWKYIDGLGNGFNIDFKEAYKHSETAPQFDPETGKVLDLLYPVKEVKAKADGITGQLYNLKDDPQEKKNLFLERPEVVKELKALLKKYQTETRSVPLR